MQHSIKQKRNKDRKKELLRERERWGVGELQTLETGEHMLASDLNTWSLICIIDR